MDNMNDRALITGAAGFLGRYIGRELRRQAWHVIGVDREQARREAQEVFEEFEVIQLPSDGLASLLRKSQPFLLVHAAGPASVPLSVSDPLADFTQSVPVFYDLLDAVRSAAPDCRVLLLSSAAVYGQPDELPVTEQAPRRPISPYGYHKLMCELAAEEFARVYGVKTACARVWSAYGPGLRRQVLWDMLLKLKNTGELRLDGTGEETRDFIHAADVARAIAVIGSEGTFKGEAYNVGTGRETSVRALANLLLSASARPNAELIFSGSLRSGDPQRWRSDISLLKGMGFEPQVKIEAGVREYVQWASEREAKVDIG